MYNLTKKWFYWLLDELLLFLDVDVHHGVQHVPEVLEIICNQFLVKNYTEMMYNMMNSSLSLMLASTMVSNMSLRYFKSFAINSSSIPKPKWYITWQKNNFIYYLMNSSLSLMSTSIMESKMSLRYLKSFAINSPSKTRLKWCITWQKNYFINYLINSSLSLMSTSTMESNMSLMYLKKLTINSPSKTRPIWCIK